MNKYWMNHNPSLTYLLKILLAISHSNRSSISELYYKKSLSYRLFEKDIDYSDLYENITSQEYIDNIFSNISKYFPKSLESEILKIVNMELQKVLTNFKKTDQYKFLDKDVSKIINTILYDCSDHKIILNRVSGDLTPTFIFDLPIKYAFRYILVMLLIDEINNDELGHYELYSTMQLLFGKNNLFTSIYD